MACDQTVTAKEHWSTVRLGSSAFCVGQAESRRVDKESEVAFLAQKEERKVHPCQAHPWSFSIF